MSLLNGLPEHEIKAVAYILGSILSLIGQSNHRALMNLMPMCLTAKCIH